jgi:hypothetical protein
MIDLDAPTGGYPFSLVLVWAYLALNLYSVALPSLENVYFFGIYYTNKLV